VGKDDYRFPRLFVENPETSTRGPAHLHDRGECVEVRTGEPEPGDLVEIPYEQGFYEILVLEEARIRKRFATLLPARGEALILGPGVQVGLIEAAGTLVHIFPREGDKVEKWEKVAYVVSAKNETRVVKAPMPGVLVYIAWNPEYVPEKYILVVAGEGDVERKRVCGEG